MANWFPIVFMLLVGLVSCVTICVPFILYIQKLIRQFRRRAPDGRTLFQYCERERSKHAVLLEGDTFSELQYDASDIESKQVFSPYLSEDQKTEVAFEIMSSASNGTWTNSSHSYVSAQSLPLRPGGSRRSSITSLTGSRRSSITSLTGSRRSFMSLGSVTSLPVRGGREYARQKRKYASLMFPNYDNPVNDPTQRRKRKGTGSRPSLCRKNQLDYAILENKELSPQQLHISKKSDTRERKSSYDQTKMRAEKVLQKKVLKPSKFQHQQQKPRKYRAMPKGKTHRPKPLSDSTQSGMKHSHDFKDVRDSLQLTHRTWGTHRPKVKKWHRDQQEFYTDSVFHLGTGGNRGGTRFPPEADSNGEGVVMDLGGAECPGTTTIREKHFANIMELESYLNEKYGINEKYNGTTMKDQLWLEEADTSMTRSRSVSEMSPSTTDLSVGDLFPDVDESGGEVTPRAI